MDLSVIIVNYNVRQFLENALASVKRALEGLQGEIIVVDNASTDGSAEMIRSKFPDVTVIENRENVGFARANNTGLKLSRGRYFLLINPDTIVQEDTIHVMLRFFAEHPDAGLAGCKILNPDGSFQLPCRRSIPTPWVAFTKIFGLSAIFPKSRLFGRYNLTYLDPDESYPVDAVSGSFMMMSRETYEKVGGLDESFFMYGEDLDWCYRVSRAGFTVYYVHSTKIVHFKGESTKRSEIDEIKLFYEAMQLFVKKHFNRSSTVRLFLSVGIFLRGMMASLGRSGWPIILTLVDSILVDVALLLSALIYFGDFLHFARNANPVVWVVPALVVVVTMFFSGLYTTNRFSVSRAGVSVIVSYVIISALVYFAKEVAYSRAVVLISGFLNMILLPGWRLGAIALGRVGGQHQGRRSLFGRRTVIVGTGPSGQEVLRKLRARVDGGYDVLGFISLSSKEIGDRVAGVEVIGSMDNVGKVINEKRVGEIIFSTDGISYTDILSVIARSNNRSVNFRLVPSSLEAIIGKTRIDQLDVIPLVEIEYNIHRPANRIVKRMFDIGVSGILLLLVYPCVRIITAVSGRRDGGALIRSVTLLPQVFSGRLSLVGLPLKPTDTGSGTAAAGEDPGNRYLGPRGLTGLVQINAREDVSHEEIERYELYYAKNQSLALDLEILLKSFLLLIKT